MSEILDPEIKLELGKTTKGYLIGAWHTASFIRDNSPENLEPFFDLARGVLENEPRKAEGYLTELLQGASFAKEYPKKHHPNHSGYKGEGTFGVPANGESCTAMSVQEAVAALSILRTAAKEKVIIISRKDVLRLTTGENIDEKTKRTYRQAKKPSHESVDHAKNELD